MDTAGAEEGEGTGTDLEGWLHVTLGREKGSWEQQHPSLPQPWFHFAPYNSHLFSRGTACFPACASNQS